MVTADYSMEDDTCVTVETTDESKSKKPLIKNTFVGGVRYFAPTEDAVPLSDNEDASPFEPNRPVFQSNRGFKKQLCQDDTGDRPFSLFGDILDKIFELQLSPESSDVREAIEARLKGDRIFFKRAASLTATGASTLDNLPSGAIEPSVTDAIVAAVAAGSGQTSIKSRDVDRFTAKDAFGRRSAAGFKQQRKTVLLDQPVSPSRTGYRDNNFNINKPFTPEEQLKVDSNSLIADVYSNGTRVLGKWVDKNFYPGVIVRYDNFGSYRVKFADGEFRDLSNNEIVPLFRIKPGDELMLCVSTRRGEYEFQPSIISKCPDRKDPNAWFEGIFEVENSTKLMTETVSWEKFAIESKQAKNYMTVKRAHPTSIPQPAISTSTSSGARRSSRPKRPKLLDNEEYTAVSYDEEEEDITMPLVEPDDRPDDYDYDDQEELSNERRRFYGRGRGRGRGRGGRGRGRGAQSNAALGGQSRRSWIPPHQVMRPRPPSLAAEPGSGREAIPKTAADSMLLVKPFHQASRAIFTGMKFVLTSATRSKENAEEDNAPPMMPFIKRQVRQMIEERGGVVVDDFSQLSDQNDCYLVADQYYRTHKYLSALVRAVPCVSHMWIFECCKENKLLHPTIFLLPAGRSLETNQLVKWHDKCPTMLSGVTALIYTQNRPDNPNTLNFVQIWTPIVKMMGADVIERLPVDGEAPAGFALDLLLTDSSCPDYLVQKAEAYGGQCVSSEWLIQGIITGRLPNYDASPKYRHDYMEMVESGSPQGPASQMITTTTATANQRPSMVSGYAAVPSGGRLSPAPPLLEPSLPLPHQSHSLMHSRQLLQQLQPPVTSTAATVRLSDSPMPVAVVEQCEQSSGVVLDDSATAALQPQVIAVEAADYVDAGGSMAEAIDITNLTADQLQALGIQFVEASDLAAVLGGQQLDENQVVEFYLQAE